MPGDTRASYLSEGTFLRSVGAIDHRVGREEAAVHNLVQPGDATSYRQPRIYSEEERDRMATYESVDAFEPHNSVYLDHLQFRYHEPRWFIWVFTLVVGFLSGASAVVFVACMHVMMNMKYYLLDYALKGFPSQSNEDHHEIARKVFSGVQLPMQGTEDRNVVLGYLVWASFSVVCALIAAMLLKLVPEARGVGSPDVLAYLNGVDNHHMMDKRVFVARIVISLFTIASGACTGYFGTLVQSGVMIASFVTERSRLIQFPNINVIRCFRNPKDRRNLSIIGAAAGVGSAFSVTIGGLMYVVEQVAQVIPVRVALYTFCSCLVSSFTLQVYFSYMNSFSERDRSDTDSGALLKAVLIIFDTKLIPANIISMNIFDIIPSVIIGVICGVLAVIYVRVSWVSLRLRRRLQRTLFHNFKFMEPVVVTFAYVTITYWIAVAWGPHIAPTDTPSTGCSYVPAAFEEKRRTSVVGYYGMVSSLCNLGPISNASDAQVDPFQPGPVDGRLPVVHNFASLALAPADSALQFLLSWSTADYLQLPTLAVFFVVYFLFTSLTAGIAMSGDVILPALVIGGTVGRMVGQVARQAAQAASPETLAWADPAVFALIGAGSFLGGVSGMTFSVCIILMEMTGDNRHIICIMIGITISKLIADRFCHPITVSHLEAKCVPVLDFATRIHKYDMFCARNIMQSPVLTFTSVMDAKSIVDALTQTPHNGFPVVSASDRTFKGMVLRWQLEIILWNLHWTRKGDACTYARMREIEDRRFTEKLTGLPPLTKARLRTQIDLMVYVDQSAYTIHEATSLSRTYHLFRTLGLRHLVVINRSNQVVGMITRKDLVSDRMMERIQQENEKRRAQLGIGPGEGVNAYYPSERGASSPQSPNDDMGNNTAGGVAGDREGGPGGDLSQDALSTFLFRQREAARRDVVVNEPLDATEGASSTKRLLGLGLFGGRGKSMGGSRKMPKLSELVIDEHEDQEYTIIDIRDGNTAATSRSGGADATTSRGSTHNSMVRDDERGLLSATSGDEASLRASNAGGEGYLRRSMVTATDADALEEFYTRVSRRDFSTASVEPRRSEAIVTSPLGLAPMGSYMPPSPMLGGLGLTTTNPRRDDIIGSDSTSYLPPALSPMTAPAQNTLTSNYVPQPSRNAAPPQRAMMREADDRDYSDAESTSAPATEGTVHSAAPTDNAMIDEVIEEDDTVADATADAPRPEPAAPISPSKAASPDPLVPQQKE